MSPGGKGANQAVAAARLGGFVSMAGCVGADTNGKALLKNLKDNNVYTDHIRQVQDKTTGVAVIIVDKDGDNSIILDAGANASMDIEYISHIEYVIRESDYILMQLEIPMPVIEYVCKIAKKHGKFVVLDPAPAVQLKDELMQNVDLIKPNETECSILTGIDVNSLQDAKKAADIFIQRGVDHVVISMGENGIFYFNGQSEIHIPALHVEAVDTTAAGDTFTGALVSRLATGKSMEDSLKFAVVASGLAVTRKGAQSSIPCLHNVEKYMRREL